LDKTKKELKILDNDISQLVSDWDEQKEIADKIIKNRTDLNNLSTSKKDTCMDSDKDIIIEDLFNLRTKLHEIQKDNPLVFPEVDDQIVASVVSDWTGIPTGRMVKDQANLLLDYENLIGKSLIGQDHALKAIGDSIRINKSGMGRSNAPIGVFLLVGPSGVGKTETARLTADLLFGGEKMLTTMNMSEYQEKHTVSQLKGAPPGYVGYGEGGVLTEAVRRKPYSVVLLDEVEKADKEVMNLFYQVFDKGIMRDGEGREIDFKNTIIIMTSNIGSDTIIQALLQDQIPDMKNINELIQPELMQFFQTALLARMKIIPFYSLDEETINKIVSLKMEILRDRITKSYDITVDYDDEVIKTIAGMCNVTDTGARNIEFTIERQLLPKISRELIQNIMSESPPTKLEFIAVENDVEFRLK